MNEREQIIEEIKQIVSQYKNEVPGPRRAWPYSIKQTVLGLQRMKMSYMSKAKRTGIPYMTVLKWRDSESGQFKQLSTVTLNSKLVPNMANVTTVKVTTCKGIKIEGITFEQALMLLERFE